MKQYHVPVGNKNETFGEGCKSPLHTLHGVFGNSGDLHILCFNLDLAQKEEPPRLREAPAQAGF